MPTPTTTNLSIGSIFDLLVPTTPLRRDEDQSAFGELLTPPRPPASPPPTEHKPGDQTVQRASDPPSREPAAPTADCRDEAPRTSPSNDSQNQDEPSACGDEGAEAPGDEAPPIAEAGREAQPSDRDAQLVAQSLAGILPAPPPNPLPISQKSDDVVNAESKDTSILPASKPKSRRRENVAAAPIAVKRVQGNSVPETASPSAGQPQPIGEIASGREGKTQAEELQAAEQSAVNQAALKEQAENAAVKEAAVTGAESQATEPIAPVSPAPEVLDEGADHKRQESVADQPEPVANATTLIETAQSPDASSKNAQQPVSAVASAPSPIATPASTSENRSPNAINLQSQSVRPRAPQEATTERSGLAARRGTVEVDAARLLTRVTRALQTAQQRDGEIRLRLSPPELGSLRLTVHVQDGLLVARMETETSAARSAIIDNLPALRERLAEQGVRIERFDVDLMQRQFGGMPDRPQDQGQQPQPAVRSTTPVRSRGDSTPVPRPSQPTIDAAGRLNVII